MQRILVTGSGGFIGGHLVSSLSSKGNDTVCLDRNNPGQQLRGNFDNLYTVVSNLNNINELLDCFHKYDVDSCIHLAGTSNVSYSYQYPISDLKGQIYALSNLLEAIRVSGRPIKLLLVSSAAVYGNPGHGDIDESQSEEPISPYGFHKLMQEQLCDEYRVCYGVPSAIARIFSSYGPGQKNLAVWDIAKKALDGRYELMCGEGDSRDYLYISDIVNCLELIMIKGSFSGDRYNVASGSEVKIVELARLIYGELGIDEQPIVSDSGEVGKPSNWRANINRIRELGFSQNVDLNSGIKETVRWIRANV